MKKNKKGYILIQTVTILAVVSIISISLATAIANKVSINKRQHIEQSLYITAKSALTTLEQYFSQNQKQLKSYILNKNTKLSFYIDEGKKEDDIKNAENKEILVRFYKTEDKSVGIMEATVWDKDGNKVRVSKKICY